MGVCNCSMFCCKLHYVHSSFAIILMGKRGLVALLSLSSSLCLVIVVWLFLAVPWVCLQFVTVVFPDHTHLLFLKVHVQLFSGNIGIIFGLALHLFSFFVSTNNEGFGNTAHTLSILATPLQDTFQGFSV